MPRPSTPTDKSTAASTVRFAVLVIATGVLTYVAFRAGAQRVPVKEIVRPAAAAPAPGESPSAVTGQPDASATASPTEEAKAVPVPFLNLSLSKSAEAAGSQRIQDAMLRMMRTRHAQTFAPVLQAAGIPEAQFGALIEILARKSMDETRLTALMLAPGLSPEENAPLRAEYDEKQAEHLAELRDMIGDPVKSGSIELYLAQEPNRALLASYQKTLDALGFGSSSEQNAAVVEQSYQVRRDFAFTVDLSNPAIASPVHLSDEATIDRYLEELRRLNEAILLAVMPTLGPDQMSGLRQTLSARFETTERDLRNIRTRINHAN
jgi:hypothetical protein